MRGLGGRVRAAWAAARAGRGMVETTGVEELTIAQYLSERDRRDLQLVDVRENEEWLDGRIAGSILIPLGELAVRVGELAPARPVVTVCRSGRRSLVAAGALQAAGFVEVRSLAGGLLEWAAAGQPVEW